MKCVKRDQARARYQALTPEQRREIIAARDPERTKANDRARHARHRAARLAAVRARASRYRDLRPQYMARWQERNPEKRRAHFAVHTALRNGGLVRQPCESCGSPVAQAHHDDYSKPLDVRWLCSTHHAEHHVRERALARGDA